MGGGVYMEGREGGKAARMALMTRLVFFFEARSCVFKRKAIRGRLVLLCSGYCSDLVKLSSAGQSVLDRNDW